MKKELTKKEAELYLRSLPFKDELKPGKHKYIDGFVKRLAEDAEAEKRNITFSEVQDIVRPFVTSLDSHMEFTEEEDGITPPKRLEVIQKEIDTIRNTRPFSMREERRIQFLQMEKKKLHESLRS